jgi:hypothetical protein
MGKVPAFSRATLISAGWAPAGSDRPLGRLAPERRREAWHEVIKSSP